MLTITLHEIVVRHWWQLILQTQTAPRLRRAFRRSSAWVKQISLGA